MRVVRAVVAERGDLETLLPTERDLQGVRDLPVQFPDAQLSRCTFLRVPRLDERADPSGKVAVWLAIESLQITGSFKIRGALFALKRLKAHGVQRVVAASAGNHGAGIAWAAKVLGMEATIVVPVGASTAKVDAIRRAGATVLEEGEGYDAAESRGMALAAERGEPFVSPYDDVDVIAGNGGSLGMELAGALGSRRPVVLAPMGGGGLATGMASALGFSYGERLGSVRRVWGVQSEASPAFALSLERGAAVTALDPKPTLADGLEGGIAARAFARAEASLAGAIVVPEAAIAAAMGFARKELGLVLEGSAAVALVPLLDGVTADVLGDAVDVVAVLSGRNIDAAMTSRLATMLSEDVRSA